MRRSLISAAVLALAGIATLPVTAAPHSARAELVTTQLPRTVRPLHYDVAITPDAKAATFTGSVSIRIEVLAPTRSITLNAADLAFKRATLTGKGAPQQASVSINNKEQTATFSVERPLAKGSYTLALDYTGVIGTQAAGLFSIDYDMADGRKRALYTQFENSDARRMIPSWDEPAFRTTFNLEATIPAGQMAISNMPIASSTALPDGRSMVKFGTSPKMSTYLLFFGLGEFDRATTMVDGVEIGVVTKKGGKAQAAFVLDESKALLRHYNDYFGQPFPLPKLDNVAAPGRSQFFGAMENWGAIFTFEHAMLLDPAISTVSDKQEAFATAAHEMAHQWFGDLVTMRWWDDLWLNEGFATWMEGRVKARLHPEWNSTLSAIKTREIAMAPDSITTTHPVVQRIMTVEQASQAFDSITYRKGATVIGMLERYVGEDAWRKGVRAYMKAHAYGNTASSDLWTQIEKAAGKPIKAIAHDFTMQPGVPLISVVDAVCKNGSTTVNLRQGQFSRDMPDRKALSWRVPVIAQVVGQKEGNSTLVVGGKGSVTVPGCGAVVVNAGQSGYFRTQYAPASFMQLAKEFAQLAPIDQMGMMTDTWALGMAGKQDAADFLSLADATPLGADPQVWGTIAGIFDQVNTHYQDEPANRKLFADYAIKRLSPLMAQLGWAERAEDTDSIAKLRTDLIEFLSNLGDPTVIAESRRRFAAAATDPSAMPGGLRKTIQAVVAQHADAATWDKLHQMAIASTTPMIKDDLYDLLASSSDRTLAQRALDLALTDEPGVTNSAAMISSVSTQHPELAIDFVLAHVPQVHERVDASSRSRYVARLAKGSGQAATIGKLNAYADANLAASARGEVQASISSINDRLRVRAERMPAITSWLRRNVH
jgi:aminopeptidase N